jgi:hypothetical protein
MMVNLAGYVMTYSNSYRTSKSKNYTAVIEVTDPSLYPAIAVLVLFDRYC